MDKNKAEKPRREVAKRQLSHWQLQRKRQRWVFGIGIFIIVASLGIIGGGWCITQYQPLRESVIKVNDTEFNMDYYVKMLQVLQYPADEVVRVIQQNEVIRQGAERLGIIVSNEVADEELKSHGPPFNDAHRDVVRTQMLIGRLLDEYFEQEILFFDEQRQVMAMFVESDSQAAEIRVRLEVDGGFTELAGEFSLDGFTKGKKGDLDWRTRDVLTLLLESSILGEYVFDSKVGVLSQPIYDEAKVKGVGYWLIEVLEREEDPERAYVQAILLGSEGEAQEIRAKLEAGEGFATLAKGFSQLQAAGIDGGDLEWLTPGIVSAAFDEFVFDLELGIEVLSEPIRDDMMVTTGGYWLVQVLSEDDNRKIEDEDRYLLKAKALDEWGTSLFDKSDVEDYLDDDKQLWAISRAAKELGR